MKGDKKVIELLNEALKNELTAINQYWLHYRMLDNWGVHKLAEFERHESIDEMKHADKLAERILFLDGLPNFQALGRLRIGENVEEILKADLAAGDGGADPAAGRHRPLREGARLCQPRPVLARSSRMRKSMSTRSRQQFEMIARMGLQNYIQLQSEAAEGLGSRLIAKRDPRGLRHGGPQCGDSDGHDIADSRPHRHARHRPRHRRDGHLGDERRRLRADLPGLYEPARLWRRTAAPTSPPGCSTSS